MSNIALNRRQGFYEKSILSLLSNIKKGHIIWHSGEEYEFGDKGSASEVSVTVEIKDPRFYQQFFWRGSIGAAESYMAAEWCCDDLAVLIKIIVLNQDVFNQIDRYRSPFYRLFSVFKARLLRNHVSRSKSNILAHYDLGNDFFSLFLDDTKMYSSAIFEDPEWPLEQAQLYKLRKICDMLKLKKTDHVLEIGSGWGGFAFFAARHYGCQVTTTTISEAQYDFVKEKIRVLGLEKQIHLLKKDYRQLLGQYDKLVSIEMIEAVGHQYTRLFFEVCNRLLKRGGIFCLQAITMNDISYDQYKKELDFIKAYIFPGGCLPSLGLIREIVGQHTGMVIQEIDDIGRHYGTTLKHWQARLLAASEQVKDMGFDERFLRMFDFYFAYCRGGFDARHISNFQIAMEKQ